MAKKVIRRQRGAVAEAKAVAAKLTPRDKKTMGSIVGLADGVVVAAEKRRDPYVDIPSRTLSNVHYSPRKRILEMGNATNRRQLFDLSQAKAYMRTMLVASGCKKLIDAGQDHEPAGSVLHAQAHDRRHEGKHVRRPERVRHDHRRRRSAAGQPPRGAAPVRRETRRDGRQHHVVTDKGDEIDCSRMGSGGYAFPRSSSRR